MKPPNAHSESIRICISHRCCIFIEDLTHLLDFFTKISVLLSKCGSETRIFNDINLCKNILANLLSEYSGIITRVKQLNGLKYDVVLISTLTNMINRIIELRNIIQRLNENAYECTDTQKIINEAYIDTLILLIKYSSLLLFLISKANNIDQDLAGKISSSLASALFASLLNIHNRQILENLKACIKIT